MSEPESQYSGGEYCRLRVRIFARRDEGSPYPVEAELDDGSWYSGHLKFGPDEQAELLALEPEVTEYGEKLGSLLFVDEILVAYQTAAGRAREIQEGRLRIQLWISPECSELQAIMWERAYIKIDGKYVPLSCSDLTPFSRFTRLSKADPKPIAERPFKLLMAISNPNPETMPEGYAPIQVEDEVRNLMQPLAGIEDLAVTLLPGRTGVSSQLRKELVSKGVFIEEGPTTPESLQVQLASHHILHFLGHGTFRRDDAGSGGTSFVILEKPDGNALPVSDTDLVARLAAFKDVPRLIFLASCETAKREPGDPHPFVGLGPKLVEAGFPAVVAMQEKVPMELAARLTHLFYLNLLGHGLIDLALNESRKFLLDQQSADWAIPVLFMRTPGGRLFAPNPVVMVLREMARAAEFKPKWHYGNLPLEAVLLSGGRQRSPDWERIVEQIETRSDLWKQTREILQPGQPGMIMLAISGRRGTARSTHLRRLVRDTVRQSLSSTDGKRVLPIYVDLDKAFSELGPNADFLSMVAYSLSQYWPGEIDGQDVRQMLEDSGTILRLIVDNLEDLPEMLAAQAIKDIRNQTRGIDDSHQFVIAIGHGGLELRTLPVTHLLDVQFLSRRKVQQFLRDEIGRDEDEDPANAPRDETAVAIGARLADTLEKTQLFDLAAQPWLLVRMVERATEESSRLAEGELWPPSRALLLKDVVEGKVKTLPRERGLQSCALPVMFALAGEMHFTGRSEMSLQEAMPIIAEARGDREFGLEEILTELSRVDLMAITGDDAVRFLYPSLQSYCCACSILEDLPVSGRDDFWRKIITSLGGLNQIRWWFETLVLLCGLLTDSDELIEQIIYGESFAESEKVFLTARCLLESERVRETRKTEAVENAEALADQIRNSLLWLLQKRNSSSVEKLTSQVTRTVSNLLMEYTRSADTRAPGRGAYGRRRGKAAADDEMVLDAFSKLMERVQIVGSRYVADRIIESLIWRSSSVNEPRSYQRLRAIEELGRFRRPEIVAHLARVAMAKVRLTWARKLSFEYGGIRQAAGRAIRRMMPEYEPELREADPDLADLVDLWKKGGARGGTGIEQIDRLASILKLSRRQAAEQKIKDGIPEMAAFALGDIQTRKTRDILYDAILETQTPVSTQWAISDAIALLEPNEVMDRVVLKLIPSSDELADPELRITSAPNKRWHEMMIYLIGQLRFPEPRALNFVELFLQDPGAGFGLKARAMLALASLHQDKYKSAFEDAALGNFEAINLDQKLWAKSSEYLKIKAIEALAEIGDADSLRRIRGSHREWTPEIERVFYITSEEINWRIDRSG